MRYSICLTHMFSLTRLVEHIFVKLNYRLSPAAEHHEASSVVFLPWNWVVQPSASLAFFSAAPPVPRPAKLWSDPTEDPSVWGDPHSWCASPLPTYECTCPNDVMHVYYHILGVKIIYLINCKLTWRQISSFLTRAFCAYWRTLRGISCTSHLKKHHESLKSKLFWELPELHNELKFCES